MTAVEFMPVHQFVADRHLVERGLTNYWGYNSIAFFAPHVGYATGGLGQQVSEFKSMVKALHRAGLEVILDVVYNHTGEGNQLGPTLSLRGIDNSVYYRLDPETPATTSTSPARGTASTSCTHAPWRSSSTACGTGSPTCTSTGSASTSLPCSPVASRRPAERLLRDHPPGPGALQVKLIAEPWDVGPDGYQLGRFPPGWSEWNGAFRDCVRRFWRGDAGQVPELASRLTGSSDIYAPGGRRTYASMNYVTCHDGFTLTDLVSLSRSGTTGQR